MNKKILFGGIVFSLTLALVVFYTLTMYLNNLGFYYIGCPGHSIETCNAGVAYIDRYGPLVYLGGIAIFLSGSVVSYILAKKKASSS